MNEGRPRKPPLSRAPEGPTEDAKSERISRPEVPTRGPLATLKNIVMRDGRRRKSLPPEPKLQSNPKSVTTDTSATPPVDPELLWSGRLRPGEEVGRGAMGYVIRATDTKLRRELALKVSPAPRDQLSRDQLARFIEEAQVTAQLEHPNVVPVHDIGVDPEGRVYFSMKLIRGRSLEAILDLRRTGDAEILAEFGLRRLLDVFLQACQAVEYAHARNVVHRDLKPANIMVGDFGEVLVMDWGVAKLMDRGERPITIPPGFGPTTEPARRESESGLLRAPGNSPAPDVTSVRAGKKALETQLGTVIGTPAYMSPEQATGSAVDGRADLYALGVILYEILCGQVPFNDEDPRVLITQVLSQAPRPPSAINPSAPLALESLAMRLLSKAPADRTLTLRQIRAHVQDYIEGFGRDYEKESLFRNVAWFGGAIGVFVFLVWYLTGRSIGAVLALAPPAVFNAFGWFLLVLSVRYPLWAAYVALSHRGEHDRFRPPNDEELFVSGYAAHRTFAAALAPIFQLTFVVELVSMAIAQATRQGASFEVATRALTLVRAGWANALISIFVFLFAYLMLLAAEVRYARRIDRFALFVGRAAWESTWPSFLIVVLLLSITATGLLDWVLAPAGTNLSGFFRERVFAQAPNAFEVVKTLVFQGTFLIGLVGATLLVSFPFAEILASLRLPFQAADEASVRSRQQYFLRSVAFFRLARASWLYGGAMIGCLTAITILTDETRRPIATQVLYISGPWLIGFFGFYLARRYLQQFLANAPAVERLLEESALEARREQARANHIQVKAAPLQSRLIELAVPALCVLVYLVWTGSAVDQASIQALVLPVSTKGWLLILPYALMLPVILGRDQVMAYMLRRQSDATTTAGGA